MVLFTSANVLESFYFLQITIAEVGLEVADINIWLRLEKSLWLQFKGNSTDFTSKAPVSKIVDF